MKLPPFFVDTVKRFVTKNPKYFRHLQVASGIVAVIAFAPELLSYLEIDIPVWMHALESKFVKVGSLLTILIAQLPNEDQTAK